MKSRRGATRTEVATVIFCTLVLSALAVLFLQNGRTQSRRLLCERTLQQVGMGVRQYLDDQRLYPLGTAGSRKLPAEKRWSWIVTVSEGIFPEGRAIPHPTKGWDEAELGRAMRVKGKMIQLEGVPYDIESRLICPEMSIEVRDLKPARTTYVGLAGIGEGIEVMPLTQPRIGVFGYDRQLSPQQIPDGFKSTLMVLETREKLGPWLAGGKSTVRGVIEAPGPYIGRDSQFGGLHLGGGYGVFADGRVQFLDEGVDPQVFLTFISINDTLKAKGP